MMFMIFLFSILSIQNLDISPFIPLTYSINPHIQFKYKLKFSNKFEEYSGTNVAPSPLIH